MKILAWYVERCRVVKGFKLRASLLAGVIGTLIFTAINVSVGYEFKHALIMGGIIGIFVLVMWNLFISRTIKLTDKLKKREEDEELRIKEEKRERARQNAIKKNNKKKR